MSLMVQKFGGTSLADAEKIHRAARRAIRAKLEGHRVVLVVSAMGKTTNELLGLAFEVTSTPPQRELDMLLTTGEQVSIALMAMAIDEAGHNAISLTAAQLGLVTDSAHTRARIQRISRNRVDRELDLGKIVIVAGFQGIDASGELTTMGRGASDTTATALAGVLGAEVCEIYTDVDGVYTADPRIVPQARKINRLSYEAMLELAACGAGVMHPVSIEFAQKYGFPVHIRSSMTDGEGTFVMSETPDMAQAAVQGVTLKEDLAVVTLRGVPNSTGVVAQIFDALASRNIVIGDIVQAIHGERDLADISFSIGARDVAETTMLCELLVQKLGISQMSAEEDVSKVSAVGVGVRSHAGVAARMFDALAQAGINIQSVSTSEIVLSCLVRRKDGIPALRAAHDAFKLGESQGPALNSRAEAPGR